MTPQLHVSLAEHLDFRLGETVYFPANPEKRGVVVGICIRASGESYAVTWDDLVERWHTAIELCREKPSPV